MWQIHKTLLDSEGGQNTNVYDTMDELWKYTK